MRASERVYQQRPPQIGIEIDAGTPGTPPKRRRVPSPSDYGTCVLFPERMKGEREQKGLDREQKGLDRENERLPRERSLSLTDRGSA